jgi:hypothetical protein
MDWWYQRSDGWRPGCSARGRQPSMTEQNLDDPDIGSGLQQVRRKPVAQRMDRHRLAQLHSSCGLPTGALLGGDTHWFPRVLPGKQPPSRPGQPPIRAQDLQQLWRQHDVAIFAARALLNPYQHPAAVDGSRLRARDFANAQPCTVGGRQCHPAALAGHGLEEPHDLVAAEHDRQPLRLACGDDTL